MSRAKAKMALLHDLQCKNPDYIITKKECDIICKALLLAYSYNEVRNIFLAFKKLTLS